MKKENQSFYFLEKVSLLFRNLLKAMDRKLLLLELVGEIKNHLIPGLLLINKIFTSNL